MSQRPLRALAVAVAGSAHIISVPVSEGLEKSLKLRRNSHLAFIRMDYDKNCLCGIWIGGKKAFKNEEIGRRQGQSVFCVIFLNQNRTFRWNKAKLIHENLLVF